MKRKTIDEYFNGAGSDDRHKLPRTTQEHGQVQSLDISGLRIVSDFVTKSDETMLLAFLDVQKWRTDLSRRVIHYGGTYCLMPPRTATSEERKVIENTIITADPIPQALSFIVEKMVQYGIYQTSNIPEYCIVNEYRENQGISAHVENFKFISPVCGLTLGNGGWIRFHELTNPDDGSVRSGKAAKAKRTGKKVDVWMPPRSLLVMSGDAREKWQHEIVRNRKDRTGSSWRRVSLTFRAESKSAK